MGRGVIRGGGAWYPTGTQQAGSEASSKTRYRSCNCLASCRAMVMEKPWAISSAFFMRDRPDKAAVARRVISLIKELAEGPVIPQGDMAAAA